MPGNTSGAAVILTATQIRGVTVGVAAAMLVTGVGGLAATLAIEEDVPALRVVTIGAFAVLLVAGLIAMAVATVRGLAAIIRHQSGIERAAAGHFSDLSTHQERLERAAADLAAHHERIEQAAADHFAATARMVDDCVQDRLDQIEHLLVKVNELLKRQADVIGDVVEKQIEIRNDELASRRNHRSG